MTFCGISRIKSTACSALCVFSLTSFAALAQTEPPQLTGTDDPAGIPESYDGPASSVAAVVNDKVISTYDIQQRIRMMMLSSGGQFRPEMMPQLVTQAMKDLVEEKLKGQEIVEFEVEYEESEIDAELSTIAAQGGMTIEQLKETLEQGGVSIKSLREQVKIAVAWPRLVQGRYAKRVRVSDDEVEATLERLREDASKEQLLVSEICIPVPEPSEAQQYYEGSLQLLEQMRRGVPFAVIAQQFSACTSAAAGGDMGWVRPGELPDEIGEALRELPAGAVTNPISSEGAFMIMALRDKREAIEQGEPSFTFAYAGAPLSMGRSAARTALEKLSSVDACGGRAQRRDLGPDIGVALIENVTLSQIDERFQSAVEDLDRHELSPIIEADEALHAVYVCEKDEGLGLPSRDAIKDRIYARQLTRIAQQYLRDVERKSLVDIRLKSEPAPNG